MTAREVSRVLICSALLMAATAGNVVFFGLIVASTSPFEGWFPGLPVDFKNTWFGAWTFWHADLSVLFDQYDFNVARWRFFPLESGHIWSYPLHFLMLTLPLGLLGFPAAALLWTVANVALYAWFVARFFRPSAAVWFYILISSAFLSTLVFGQVAIIASVLLIGGLTILPRRPVLAGLAFGILTIKPHFGVLLPLFLLIERQWSAIASAIVTAAVLLAFSVLVIGWEPWLAFLQQGVPAQTEAMLEKQLLWSWEPSWYAGLRQLTVHKAPALAVQFALASCSALAMVWLKGAGVAYEGRAALVPLLTLASLPYVLPADLLMVAPLIALRLADARTPLPVFAALLAFQTGAGAFFVISRLTDWPLYPALFSLVAVLCVWDAVRSARPAPAIIAGTSTLGRANRAVEA
jgi:hypothetical protein